VIQPSHDVSPGLYKRLTSGVPQFALAIGACFLLVVVVAVFSPGNGILSFGKPKENLPYADPGQAATALRLTAPYTSYAPQGLPATWRPTSSRLSAPGPASDPKKPITWHLGYVTPAGEYAALEESNQKPADDFIKQITDTDRAQGVRQVGGTGWTMYDHAGQDRSLVRQADGVTLVVTGTASYEELAVLAGALKPQPKS
jgi:hypothetical protein